MTNIIQITDLSFAYNDKFVFNNLNITFKEGLYYSIIGNNGSGKSTLAKLLVGILKQNSGEIKIKDNFKIGMVFQNPDNQFVAQKVRYDLAFGLENLGFNKKDIDLKIKDIAQKLDISHLLDYQTSDLSGGQKQRVAIASMLCMGFNVIILDEATSMIDPVAKNEFLHYIKEYKKDNDITVISITHDMSEAGSGDRVIYLKEGEVILDDTPSNVFKSNLIPDFMKPIYCEVTDNKCTSLLEFEEYLCQLK